LDQWWSLQTVIEAHWTNMEVVTWGDADSGGDSRAVKEQLQKVQWRGCGWQFSEVFGFLLKRYEQILYWVKTKQDSWDQQKMPWIVLILDYTFVPIPTRPSLGTLFVYIDRAGGFWGAIRSSGAEG
jgi:hypothetical protein